MDAHLVAVPGLGAFTARSLAGGNLEHLGGQADGTLDTQVLGLGALDELGADLLESGYLAGGEGDANSVDFLFPRWSVSAVDAISWGKSPFWEGAEEDSGEIENRGLTYRRLAEILLGLVVGHLEKTLHDSNVGALRQSDEGVVGCRMAGYWCLSGLSMLKFGIANFLVGERFEIGLGRNFALVLLRLAQSCP